MYKILFFCFTLFAISCKSTGPKTANQSDNVFGENFVPKTVISIDKLQDMLKTQDTVRAVVGGKIESVCLVKGCWINIIPEQESYDDVFVKFKDYGFFMPLDCDGRTAIMNGKGYKEITSVADLQHYAEDEGQSPEEIAKITEPIMEYKFMADGVILK